MGVTPFPGRTGIPGVVAFGISIVCVQAWAAIGYGIIAALVGNAFGDLFSTSSNSGLCDGWESDCQSAQSSANTVVIIGIVLAALGLILLISVIALMRGSRGGQVVCCVVRSGEPPHRERDQDRAASLTSDQAPGSVGPRRLWHDEDMDFTATVIVNLRAGIADPQGATIERSLPALGFDGVTGVSVGKVITFTITAENEAAASAEVTEMCARFLTNPVIEDARIEVVPA